jgi:hypothetical protein
MSTQHAEPTERAIVARGRCVGIPDSTVPPAFAGRDPIEHKEIFAPGLRYALPGEEVELTRSEVKRLRGLGTLVDPDAKEVEIETGQTHAAGYSGRVTVK